MKLEIDGVLFGDDWTLEVGKDGKRFIKSEQFGSLYNRNLAFEKLLQGLSSNPTETQNEDQLNLDLAGEKPKPKPKKSMAQSMWDTLGI